MDIEIKVDQAYREPKVLILTERITDEVLELCKRLAQASSIAGYRDGCVELLDQEAIVRIYAQSQKVYAQTQEHTYALRMRLYELMERLDPERFVRISNSEIINLKKVIQFDLSRSGTILVRLRGDVTTFVSRRYVSTIKQRLEM